MGGGLSRRGETRVAPFVEAGEVDVLGLSCSNHRHFPPPQPAAGDDEGSCQSEGTAGTGECLIFAEAARRVPRRGGVHSFKSHGRPRLRVWAEDSFGVLLGQSAEWGARHCNEAPSWFSAKSLAFPLAERSRGIKLHVELWDGKSLLCSHEAALDALSLHVRHEWSLSTRRRKEADECVVSFQVLDSSACSGPKTVHFVRHGESCWNKAQSEMQVLEMARRRDHPLSTLGRDQCQALAQKISDAKREGAASPSASLFDADVVYVSPLTRAVQTGVIALGENLISKRGPEPGQIVLMPTARERQKRGGFDSKPQKTGPEVLKRAASEIRALCGEDCDALQNFSKLRFDIQEVEDRWWHDGSTESVEALQLRMKEFMAQLLYSPHRSIIVVGHSLFFKAIFAQHMSETFRQQHRALAVQLETMKLMNCGVAKLELDPKFAASGPITSVELLLGTEFITTHRLACCCGSAQSAV